MCIRDRVIGVFDKKWMKPFAEALKENEVEHAYIVHSDDGMDEISPFAKTNIVELKNGNISEFTIDPKDLGINSNNKENLNQFLAHFSIAFTELETKITQVDEKSQANFEILEEIKEVKEIIPLVKQIHKWTFSIANLLNAELNYPLPKDGEYLQDPERENHD